MQWQFQGDRIKLLGHQGPEDWTWIPVHMHVSWSRPHPRITNRQSHQDELLHKDDDSGPWFQVLYFAKEPQVCLRLWHALEVHRAFQIYPEGRQCHQMTFLKTRDLETNLRGRWSHFKVHFKQMYWVMTFLWSVKNVNAEVCRKSGSQPLTLRTRNIIYGQEQIF